MIKTLIVFNPYSGRSSVKEELDNIYTELYKIGIVDISIFYPNRCMEITDYLKENGFRFDLLILFGGDGTLNEAVNGLMRLDKKPKLLYVPTGTVNDVGHTLKLSRRFKETVRLLKEEPVCMDVCKANDEYFIYVYACGKFTSVSYGNYLKIAKKTLGKFYYYFKSVKDFFKPISLDFNINEKSYVGVYLMLILNTQRVGNFYIRKKEVDKLNDGVISLVLFKSTFFIPLSLIIYFLFGNRFVYRFEEILGSDFKIICSNKYQFNKDGESSYFTNNVDISVIPKAIEIYVNKKVKHKLFS